MLPRQRSRETGEGPERPAAHQAEGLRYATLEKAGSGQFLDAIEDALDPLEADPGKAAGAVLAAVFSNLTHRRIGK